MGSNKGTQERGVIDTILTLIFGEKKEDILPFELRPSILTETEKKFYKVLKTVVGEKFTILSKVRMEDYIKVVGVRGWGKRQGHRNTIKSRHVDFLLCKPGELTPVLAVELDDRSHEGSKAKVQDKKKDRIYDKVGLPILRVKVEGKYKREELAKDIIEKIRRRLYGIN